MQEKLCGLVANLKNSYNLSLGPRNVQEYIETQISSLNLYRPESSYDYIQS